MPTSGRASPASISSGCGSACGCRPIRRVVYRADAGRRDAARPSARSRRISPSSRATTPISNAGLPPTPIDNPGIASIMAAVASRRARRALFRRRRHRPAQLRPHLRRAQSQRRRLRRQHWRQWRRISANLPLGHEGVRRNDHRKHDRIRPRRRPRRRAVLGVGGEERQRQVARSPLPPAAGLRCAGAAAAREHRRSG